MLHGRGVLLSTYGMVLHNADSLAGAGSGRAQQGGSGAPLWDIVILDEVRLTCPSGPLPTMCCSLPCEHAFRKTSLCRCAQCTAWACCTLLSASYLLFACV